MSMPQVVLVGLGILVAFQSQDKEPTPVVLSEDYVVIRVEDTDFPNAPANPTLKAHAELAARILSTDTGDAMSIANTYRCWDAVLVRDTKIANTEMFREVYKNATESLYSNTDIAGKYKGELDKIFTDMVVTCLQEDAGLATGLENVPIDASVRKALSKAVQAMSWAGFEGFQRSLIEEPDHATT